jgi:MoxR-like ATPase
MSISDIKDPEAVEQALGEFDRIGRRAFLDKYGFGASDNWFVLRDGRMYDAKAILGAAHEYAGLGPLPHTEFSGGPPTNQVLQRLGFEVRSKNQGGLIYLVPAGTRDAHSNFERSIRRPVRPDVYGGKAPADFIDQSVQPDGGMYLWGCFAGPRNQQTWSRMREGDFAVFVQQGHYTAVARVIAKARSPELSSAVWVEEEEHPNELIYSLTPPQMINVDQAIAADWLPQSPRGFMALGPENELRLIESFSSTEDFVNQVLLDAAPQRITWWVNQGQTYTSEKAGGYLWAPQKAKDGGPRPHWTALTETRPGDLVVHYRDGAIRAISRVIRAAQEGPRPGEFPEGAWAAEGWRVETDYEELGSSFALSGVPIERRVAESGPFDVNGAVKQGYLFRLSNDFGVELYRLLKGAGPVVGAGHQSHSLAELADHTNLSLGEVEFLLQLIRSRRQVIFQGPPGSGKTWVAEALARHLTDNPLIGEDLLNSRFELIQFHQSYGYEDFIQGIRPVTNDKGHLEYRVLPGLLMRFVQQEEWDEATDYVLVIDEINRANVARVFGELLLLLEYREKRVKLPYAVADAAKFSLPENLLIIGTMNTADRSLASIDYALRRRFAFQRLSPVEQGQAPVLQRWLAKQPASAADREEVLRLFLALNREVEARMGAAAEDFQIGHSYFMKPEEIFDSVGRGLIWKTTVRPLLEEYFQNRKDRSEILDSLEPDTLLSQQVAIQDVEEEPIEEDADVE